MNARATTCRAVLVVALGALVSGCSPDADASVLDAGAARGALDAPRVLAPRLDAPYPRDVPTDAPPLDAYDPRECVTLEPGSFGSPCRVDGTCNEGLTCGLGVVTSVLPLGDDVPVALPLPLSEGFCTTRCDARAARPCACGVCVTSWPLGTRRVSIVDASGRGVCVQPCFPDVRGGRPECNGPFGCDAFGGGCVPACTTDDECLYTSTPGGSGARFVELADEPPLPVTCALARGECLRQAPTVAPPIGAPCATDVDCALGHVCWAPEPGAPGSCAALADCARGGCGVGTTCVAIDGEAVTACAALGP